MKKTKLIRYNDGDKFEEALNEFIKDKGDCVIQYKPVFAGRYPGALIWYTALIIWDDETDWGPTYKEDWMHP